MSADALHEDLTNYLQLKVAEGFDSEAEMLRNAVEVCGDESDEPEAVIEAAAREVLKEALARHAREQKSWPARTDCDRLDSAFERLNAMGIMARHHWTCCGNCGQAEMPDEFKRLGGEIEGKPIVGYTFYHQQDSESAAENCGLCLNYGSTEPAETEDEYISASLRIATAVRDALVHEGLKVTWDGTYARRISVKLDWKRRKRPARYCGE